MHRRNQQESLSFLHLAEQALQDLTHGRWVL